MLTLNILLQLEVAYMSRINILIQDESEKLILTKEMISDAIESVKLCSTSSVIITFHFDAITKYPEILNIVNDYISENKKYKNNITIHINDEHSKYEMTYSSLGKGIHVQKIIIKHAPQLDLSALNFAITMENPEYLLMSNGTLSLLQNAVGIRRCKLDKDNMFYHSYSNIPIAITEVLEPGIIESVHKCTKTKK